MRNALVFLTAGLVLGTLGVAPVVTAHGGSYEATGVAFGETGVFLITIERHDHEEGEPMDDMVPAGWKVIVKDITTGAVVDEVEFHGHDTYNNHLEEPAPYSGHGHDVAFMIDGVQSDGDVTARGVYEGLTFAVTSVEA